MHSIPLSNEHLLNYLKSREHQPGTQEETDQIYLVFRISGQDFPLFFRIYEGATLLQLLTLFPVKLTPTRFAPVARLLHHFNKEMDIPGFGTDEGAGLIYHRIMVPALDHKIDPLLLDTLVSAVPNICNQFFPLIAKAATTDLTFEQLVS